MKITAIRTFHFAFDHSSWQLLSVETDTGLTGWGEMSDSCLRDELAVMLARRKDALIGIDPLRINDCKRIISSLRQPAMSVVRSISMLESALDQALWDITAKHLGIPLFKLFGADGTESVPLYGNLNNAIRHKRKPENLLQQGLAAKAAGFQIVKCTPFDEVVYGNPVCDLEKGLDRLRALTEVYPISQIAIDCHQRFERYNFAQMVERILTEFGNPFWIEDPVPAADYTSIRTMASRYPFVRWTAGEDSFSPADLMRLACTDCYDILMPDLKYIGGPGVVLGMTEALKGMGKSITLHNPSGIIATAHSAHISAACRSLPLEFPVNAVPFRELLTAPQESIQNGMYYLSDQPGIGMELQEDAFHQYAFEWIGSRWVRL